MNEKLIANRYKIEKKIASGGMADVFLAQDIKLDRKVAIKLLSENYASNRSFVARFKREAQILAKLNHPNIVMIYDWGQHNGSYFICMEYIEGHSLKEIIERRGIMPPREAAQYGIQICQALEAAHANNLIHRDIKPQNILVTADNTIKVTDFGIAKQALDDATKTMNIIGTANYISPEQAMGNSLDHRSDIYSLGVVLYEMITADLPFRGESSVDISLKHINETPVRPSLMVEGIPSALEKIVLHCLQKDRENRYSSASQLKKDLFRYLEKRKLSIEQPRLRKQKKPKLLQKVIGPLKVSDILLISLCLILAAVVAALLIITPAENNEEMSLVMPSLENQHFATASNILESMDIEIETTYQHNSSTPQGFIISQFPAASSDLASTEIVKLTVSQGPEQQILEVPYLIGLSEDQALDLLQDRGLSLGSSATQPSTSFFDQKIIEQDPAYGQEVQEETEVDLVLGEGPQTIQVPNIIGSDYPYALRHLQSLELAIDTGLITQYDTPPGTVIEADPAPGTEVASGSTVKLYIATNQEMSTVPDLVQMELSQAVEALGFAALNYEIREIPASYSVQKGLVMSQYPQAGSSVFLNTTVIIFVGS